MPLPGAECVYTAHSKHLGGYQRRKYYDKGLSTDGRKPGLALREFNVQRSTLRYVSQPDNSGPKRQTPRPALNNTVLY